ncbi:MAG TPA: L,D-transpeptidase family protein [Papillibacter sp.]|jgi:L,D-peptidoglycan transpeptidase YkuD (ErfK/YbiS/YcfS/YnhG family)|nr:L,D-transpeptidase family protein [Papillibacter sp.]
MPEIPADCPDSLPALPPDCRQLISVTPERTRAGIHLFQLADGAWRQFGHAISGFVGAAGVTKHKREGDCATPVGLYPLGPAFGIHEKRDTKMAYRRITPQSCWVDDPLSLNYNQWVEKTGADRWRSAEHLAEYPRDYEMALVIGYNTASRIPGRGSAIFLHVGAEPTRGCVAVPRSAMVRIFRWLDPDKNPHILISGKGTSPALP